MTYGEKRRKLNNGINLVFFKDLIAAAEVNILVNNICC